MWTFGVEMETQEKSDNTAEEVKTRVVNSNPEKGQDRHVSNAKRQAINE